jgi:hypothetical protein
MFAHMAANAVVLAHLAFIVFVIVGAWLVLKWRWVAWLHVPAVLWAAAVEFFGLICPLTPLEQRLRGAAGVGAYSGGFVEHYVLPMMYPADLTPTTQWWLGVFVVVLNVAVYALAIGRSRRA